MIALVSDHTELRRAGASEYVGRCPFHDERTPSFGVNPIDKVYYCFGCQASGDVFTFVMETEGLDFPGALADARGPLRRRAPDRGRGPAGSRASPAPPAPPVRCSAAPPPTTRDTCGRREKRCRAREYLQSRGLREETLREFRVGYAPSAWDRILTASRRAGFSDEELLAVGLAQRSQNRPGQIYDRFRERIMFPVDRRPGQRDRVRRAGDARQPAPQVPQHRRGRALPQAQGAVRPRSRARPPRPASGA